MARVLGIDIGTRRVGLAISDASRTLARPLATLRVSSVQDAVEQVMREVAPPPFVSSALVTVVVTLLAVTVTFESSVIGFLGPDNLVTVAVTVAAGSN